MLPLNAATLAVSPSSSGIRWIAMEEHEHSCKGALPWVGAKNRYGTTPTGSVGLPTDAFPCTGPPQRLDQRRPLEAPRMPCALNGPHKGESFNLARDGTAQRQADRSSPNLDKRRGPRL